MTTIEPIPRDKQIAYLMEVFDFNRVADVMKILNWTWHSTAPKTPNVTQLREVVLKCLNKVDDETTMHGTGGFRATIDHHGDLDLAFVIDDHNGCELR
jgi:hypothetical protein